MKINFFLSFISLTLSFLIGYWVYEVANNNRLECAIVSIVCSVFTLIPFMGIHYNTSRLGVNIRVFSLLFFLILIISDFLFAIYGEDISDNIILNGIILLIFLAVFYKMQGIKNI